MAVGVLFDLDQTLVDSSCAVHIRGKGPWDPVYKLIPQFAVYDGISDVLQLLASRGIPLGIVTTSPRPYCTKVVTYHGIAIDNLVCYHDTTRKKPNPDPILKGIELLGLPAGEVWAIGDDPKDIAAAHAAGAHSVAVTWGAANVEGLIAAGAERVFQSVPDLSRFLDALTRPPAPTE